MAFFKKNYGLIERLTITATSGGTLTLANNSRTYQQLTGTLTHTVTLPQANSASPNECPISLEFVVMNRSTGAVTVNYFGGSLAKTISANSQATFHLTDNSTSTGTWDVTNETSSGGGAATLSALEKLGALAGLSGELYQDSETYSTKINVNIEEAVGGDFWTTKTSVSAAKDSMSSFAINGFVYSFGGRVSSTNQAVTERFYDDNNYWLLRGNMNNVRRVAQGMAGTKGYAVGGFDSAVTSSVESYNDSTNAWANVTSLPTAKGAPAGGFYDGYGYSIGGFTGTTTALTEIVTYNETANAWYTRSPMVTGRYRLGGLLSPSFLYTAGGSITGGNASAVTEYYNSITNSSATVTSMPNNKDYATSFVANGTGYMMSGSDGVTNVVATNFKLNFSLGTWSSTGATMSVGRYDAAESGVSLNGNGYAVAGTNSGNAQTATVESYASAAFVAIPILKKTTTVPTSVLVSADINGVVTSLPARLRSDGDAWKYLTANVDSALKLNETVSAKFAESGLHYITSGSSNAAGTTATASTEFYNLGTNAWVSRQAQTAAVTQVGGFHLGGLGYSFGGTAAYVAANALSTVYSYSDITNIWSLLSSGLLSARWKMAGGVLNGFGYSVGGRNTSNTQVATVDQFSSTTGTWTNKQSLTAAGDNLLGAPAVAGQIMIAGGFNGAAMSRMELYSDVTNTWSTKTSLNTAVLDTTATALNTFGYVVGGQNSGGTTVATLQQYSYATNAWATKTAMGQVRGMAGVNIFNGNIHAATGYDGSTNTVATSEAYNDAANSWSNTASVNTARWGSPGGFAPSPYRNYELQVGLPTYLASLGGNQYIARANLNTAVDTGGCVNLDSKTYAFGASAQIYTPTLNTWTNFVAYPSGGGSVISFSLAGRAFGGDGNNTSTWRTFNPYSNAWATITSGNFARERTNQYNGVSFNGFGYVVGGDTSGTYRVESEQYNNSTNAWTTKGSLGSTELTLSMGGVLGNGYWLAVSGYGVARNNLVYSFNDSTGNWTSKSGYPITVAGVSSMNLNGNVLTFGGFNSSNVAQTSAYKYNEVADVWITQTSLGSAEEDANSDFTGMLLGGYNGAALSTTQQVVPAIKNVVLGAGLRVS